MHSTPLYIQKAGLEKQKSILWLFLGLSVLSFLTTLTLPYLGEEAVYTTTSLEMWYHQQWFVPSLLGAGYGRPPLFNWCIIPMANLLGWEYVLVAARLVVILITLTTGFLLYGLTQTLFKNKTFSLFTLCIFLSGDLLVRRGWLAYADPLFAMGVFIAIASTWLALEKQKKRWFLVTMLGLIISYLSKALTGFIFYGISILVLWRLHPNRRLLWSPFSILAHFLPLIFLLFWDKQLGGDTHNQGMFYDILNRLSLESFSDYLVKILTYPLDTLIRSFPYGALLLYFGWKYRKTKQKSTERTVAHQAFLIASWILILNYLPYWFSPVSRVRYLLPLYPFFAIVVAYLMLQWNEKLNSLKITLFCMGGCLIAKYALSLCFDPYYEKHFRGNYQEAAAKVLEKTGPLPLYSHDVSATGLSVSAHINTMRLKMPEPKSPLTFPPKEWGGPGFLLSHEKNVENMIVADVFVFGSRKVYLLRHKKASDLKVS